MQLCNWVITAYGSKTYYNDFIVYSWKRSTRWREKSSSCLTEISISAPTLNHFEKKKKNKCQESFCCCLQQHAPGYDAIMHRDMSIFCQLFQQEATSISLLCLCQHSGWEVASGVNDGQEDRWFLLSSGLMAPSFVSVIELRLTDRQIQRQDDDLL